MNRSLSILLLVLAVGALIGAGVQNKRMVESRIEYRITQAEPFDNAPPLVSFTTVALGGFRGIIADILWMRSSTLQQEGRHFELVQLADWITKLEPRFSEVWAYHAWNLAYNISVVFSEPEDRWRWVRHGISLLRDQGIRYNPDEASLLHELGWLFQHKMGASLDQAHMYYKRAWAQEMTFLLGGAEPNLFELSNLPATRSELLNEPGMQNLVDQLRTLIRDPWHPSILTPAQQKALGSVLDANPASDRFIAFVRRETMTKTYKLDIELMKEIRETYGPLDWRLPDAHAIYWATKSRRVAKGFDKVAANRMIFQSMRDAFQRGRLYEGENKSLFIPSPNPDLLPYTMAAYERAMNDTPELNALSEAYKNFLSEALFVMYSYNRLEDVTLIFNKLRELSPGMFDEMSPKEFLLASIAGQTQSINQQDALAVIEGNLYQSLLWRRYGDVNRATGFENISRMIYQHYSAVRKADKNAEERTGLPPFQEIMEMAQSRFSETL